MNQLTDQTPASPSSILASPWLFFLAVYCWTWTFWISAAALEISIQSTPGQVLLILGLLGPMLGGIGFTCLNRGKEGLREYSLRAIDPRRIRARWWLVIVLFVPVILAISVLVDVVVSGRATLVQLENRVTPFLSAPATIAPFVLRVFIRGPLPEELGWRGYVLDRLQARYNALVSSVILGAIWAVWHLPLYFFKDMLHSERGVFSPWFWQFMAGMIPTAVIFTWIFNNTRRSTLGAILFHFMANLTYELANVTDGTNLYSMLLWIIAAVLVVVIWGPALTRREHAHAA